jgi:hypothetical protein
MEVRLTCAFCGKPFIAQSWEIKRRVRKYCSHSCSQRAQFSHPLTRFWEHVQKSDKPNGCWEWQGAKTGKDTTGYGIFHGQYNHLTLAHRFSYELHKGPIPEGLFVCHTCDNRGCVNPDHLFLGTPAENAQDAAQKGRMSVLTKGHPGELNNTTKLTESDVLAIRARRANGESPSKLASEYGVARSTIYAIVTRKTWCHI